MRPTLSDAHKAVCDVFGWSGCVIVDVSDEGDVARGDRRSSRATRSSRASSTSTRDRRTHESATSSRHKRARSRLLSTRTDQVVLGAHTLWELACRPANHSQLGASSFELLLDAMHSPDLETRYIACAALWCYAVVDTTLRRLPLAKLVNLLLCELAGPEQVEPPPSSQQPNGKSGRDAANGEDEEDDDDEEEEEEAGAASTHLSIADQYSVNRCEEKTGATYEELCTWPAGALHALLASEIGMRTFHKKNGAAVTFYDRELPEQKMRRPLSWQGEEAGAPHLGVEVAAQRDHSKVG